MAASCPGTVPFTPLGRLDAVQGRLQAMIQAEAIVRSPLERFFDELSEPQRRRLTAIVGPATSAVIPLCDPRAASFANVPMDRIERTVQPTQRQEAAFEALKAAAVSAAGTLEASCPAILPQTPMARLDAVDGRLEAMVRAAQTVRPALARFYATLSEDQKARLERPIVSALASGRERHA